MFRNVTQHIDLPQIAFWLFFVAFVAICYVLRRNDKREGYPLKASPFTAERLLGAPLAATPVTYLLNEGGATSTPHDYPDPPASVLPLYRFDGTPFRPTAGLLGTSLGPGAWVMRNNEPMLNEKGELLLQPLRLCEHWAVSEGEANPCGMAVFDVRWRHIGIVADVWIDRGIRIIKHLEIELRASLGGARVLVPIFHVTINERAREIRVTALSQHEFGEVPMPAAQDRITAREEDRLNAYFAAGRFYRDMPDHKKFAGVPR
jgi:photosynthetic reaction center H subunit